jgi:hypothetical protein
MVRYFVFVLLLNETPSRIETLRMRSGVRFMILAASSNDLDALASSITRRSRANVQDLAIQWRPSFLGYSLQTVAQVEADQHNADAN